MYYCDQCHTTVDTTTRLPHHCSTLPPKEPPTMTFFDLYRRYHLAALALFSLGIVSSIHDYDKHANPNR